MEELRGGQKHERSDGAKENLQQDLRDEELGVHHEVERTEGFVGFVDTVEQVEHLERKVDDEGVEEVLGDGVETMHVDGDLADGGGDHIDDHDERDAGNHGGKEKDDGHERRGPPGIGLHRTEDEADIAMEQEGGGDADEGDGPTDAIVDAQRGGADVAGAEGEDAIEEALQAAGGLRKDDDVLAVVEPDFHQQHSHQIPEIDEAEHGHGRRAVRRQVHFQRALGMAEVELQGHGRHDEESERREQRKPIRGLDGFDAKDTLEGGENEGAGNQAGEKGVEHDEDAPLELDLVRIHESVHAGFSLSHRTIQAVIEILGAGSQMGFQHLHAVRFQEGVNGIVGIFQIGELPSAGGAVFAARGGKAFGDAVIAKRAFIGHVLGGMEVAAAVGAGLDAIAATDAIVLVDEDDAVGGVKRCANRANLRARGIRAVIAEFRDEEVLSAGELGGGKTFLAAVRRIHDGIFDVKVVHVIALDPGAEIAIGDIIFLGAGADAVAAADAFGDVQEHAPPVFGGIVSGGGLGSARKNEFPSGCSGGKKVKNLAARERHFFAPCVREGLCGWWQVSQD